MVAARVLALEAREAGLEASPEYRQRLMAIADGLLASSFMEQEVSKRATVTPEDVKRYFEAEKDHYAEPAKSTIAHIVCKSEAAAREVLRQIQEEGEDFAVMAEQESIDERTKKSGGKITPPLTKDAESIPGIGKHPDLNAAIWAVTPPSVLAEVYKSDAGWEVVKVLERTERVEKTFDEVKDEAQADARGARQREVSQQYLRELFEKRGVKLYPEAFSVAQNK
jgi:parvulin-like peptidyl-prolyl isomerase